MSEVKRQMRARQRGMAGKALTEKVFLASFAFFAFVASDAHPNPANMFKVAEIADGWTFRQSIEGADSYEASVPGTVHSDLLRHGLIDDPFEGMNEHDIGWIEECDWVYETSFDIDSCDMAGYSHIRLAFDGLDTFAEVKVNGTSVIQAMNMFVGYEKEIKHLLHAGTNKLEVRFASATKSVIGDYEEAGINYPADNDRDARHLSAYARKAPYHYGWDWGTRMVTCGIWRPAKLHFHNGQRIAGTHVTTTGIGSSAAMLNSHLEIESDNESAAMLCVRCSHKGNVVFEKDTALVLDKGMNIIDVPIEIENPELWMPNGWGEPNLYEVYFTLNDSQGQTLAAHNMTYGIREIEFVNEDDSIGKSFYFKVNGKPLFAKGANFIPLDMTLTNIGKSGYERLFKDLARANMNMVRVWGGGIYEDDYFYDLADRYGILVWQDFMFSCSTYPATGKFLENVRDEAIYNIKRLRNHPCLALWCGNNEIAEGMKYWGWAKRYGSEVFAQMEADYDSLFLELLPGLVEEHDGSRAYIDTSPQVANWGRPWTFSYGDSHYWGIWYGKQMFEVIDTCGLRFASEFGMQSFPEMKTIEAFASGSSELDIASPAMTNRQKSSIGNETILHYISNYYQMPGSFGDFVYLSQLVQGHGISYCIESNRRNRPVCMGSLYWQLNDCWPAISWSAIDYYRNKKALYYISKRAFSPVILSVAREGDEVGIFAVSDLLEELNGCTLSISVHDFEGKALYENATECSIAPNSSQKIFSKRIDGIMPEGMQERTYLYIALTNDEGETIFSKTHFFVKPKFLQLPKAEITSDIELENGKVIITLASGCLAKDVFVEIPVHGADFTDNFFDMLPGEPKTIEISGDGITYEAVKSIKITSLSDTMN